MISSDISRLLVCFVRSCFASTLQTETRCEYSRDGHKYSYGNKIASDLVYSVVAVGCCPKSAVEGNSTRLAFAMPSVSNGLHAKELPAQAFIKPLGQAGGLSCAVDGSLRTHDGLRPLEIEDGR